MHRNDFGKRLSEGVSAKLEFDWVCERGNSFSENYLHGAINEILGALVAPSDHRIHAGFPHPVLKRAPGSGGGRQKEVDFEVQPYDEYEKGLTVEAKWADSGYCKWDTVLLDLCRLHLIAHANRNAECLFVLAGSSAKVEEVIEELRRKLPERRGKGATRGVLEMPGENEITYQRAYDLFDWAGRFVGNGLVSDGLPKNRRGRPDLQRTLRSTLVKSTLSPAQRWQTVVWRVTAR